MVGNKAQQERVFIVFEQMESYRVLPPPRVLTLQLSFVPPDLEALSTVRFSNLSFFVCLVTEQQGKPRDGISLLRSQLHLMFVVYLL
jgi:hypothetical protein